MRHISKITRTDDLENELPKLLVFDFVKKGKKLMLGFFYYYAYYKHQFHNNFIINSFLKTD